MSLGDINTEGPGPPVVGFNVRLKTLLCKKLLLRNPMKWKPDVIWQNLQRKIMAQTSNDDDDNSV
jgi:hypothetical protein